MAKMIPAVATSGTKSDGELKVFQDLRQDISTKDWVVLHSLDLANHISQLSGEVDFLIFIPGLGCLCLEVKACRSVRCENGSWYYGGSTSPDNRGPFRQAEAAKHSVIEYLKRRGGLNNIPIFSTVIFTHLAFHMKSAEWNPHQVIDLSTISRDGTALAILNSVKAHRRLFDDKFGFKKEKNSPGRREIDAAVDLLRPEFEVFESAKARTGRVTDEVKKYTSEQFDALDYAQEEDRVAFDGPAGTGKSLLALETTRRLLSQGKSVLFLCYNNMLGDFLRNETSQLIGNMYCGTIDSFMLKVSNLASSKDNEFWNETLPSVAAKQLNTKQEKFDAIVIDEAQDFLNLNYLSVLDAALYGGLSNGTVKFFGDFIGQAVQKSDISLQALRSDIIRGLTIAKLSKNCRNTPRVADLATGFVNDRVAYKAILRPDDEISPAIRYYSDDQNQGELLFAELAAFRDKGLNFSDIAILSCSTKQEAAKALVEKLYGQNETFETLLKRGGLVVTTIRKFKGLERLGIIVTDIGDVTQHELEELLYIASTRSTHMLTVFIHRSLKSQINVRRYA